MGSSLGGGFRPVGPARRPFGPTGIPSIGVPGTGVMPTTKRGSGGDDIMTERPMGERMARPMQFKKGGKVKRTGWAKVHKGEVIKTAGHALGGGKKKKKSKKSKSKVKRKK